MRKGRSWSISRCTWDSITILAMILVSSCRLRSLASIFCVEGRTGSKAAVVAVEICHRPVTPGRR